MKKSFIVSVALAVTVVGASSLEASNHTQRAKSIQKEISFHNKNFKVASKDIQKGLNDTIKAIQALEKNRVKIAQKNLNNATKEFDKALKIDPKLGLVPLEENLAAYEYRGTPKNIKDALKIAQSMLAKNNLQFARDILTPLKDEIDITTHYLPMDLYPDSTKMAAKLLAKGKKKKALRELQFGLSMIVGDQVIIPIPLLSAQDLVIMASKIDKTKKNQTSKLLKRAQMELQKAKLLGYTSAHSKEYKSLENKIKSIQKEIKGKNEVEKLYSSIKEDFKSLVHKTRGDKKSFDSDSVWNNTQNRKKSATQEEDKDVVNFAQKSKLDAF